MQVSVSHSGWGGQGKGGGLVVLEECREDVLSPTAWFESSDLKLLGFWSSWRPPKASNFVPGI